MRENHHQHHHNHHHQCIVCFPNSRLQSTSEFGGLAYPTTAFHHHHHHHYHRHHLQLPKQWQDTITMHWRRLVDWIINIMFNILINNHHHIHLEKAFFLKGDCSFTDLGAFPVTILVTHLKYQCYLVIDLCSLVIG